MIRKEDFTAHNQASASVTFSDEAHVPRAYIKIDPVFVWDAQAMDELTDFLVATLCGGVMSLPAITASPAKKRATRGRSH